MSKRKQRPDKRIVRGEPQGTKSQINRGRENLYPLMYWKMNYKTWFLELIANYDVPVESFTPMF